MLLAVAAQGAGLRAVSQNMGTFAELVDSVLREPVPGPEELGAVERAVQAMRDREVDVAPSMSLLPRAAPLESDEDGKGVLRDGVEETPKTLEGLKRAFRRMVLQTHPDRPGGSHEAFLRTTKLFERALAALQQPQRTAAPEKAKVAPKAPEPTPIPYGPAGAAERLVEVVASTYA